MPVFFFLWLKQQLIIEVWACNIPHAFSQQSLINHRNHDDTDESPPQCQDEMIQEKKSCFVFVEMAPEFKEK